MDIKTAGRTLDFFEVFSAERRPLRLSDLAKSLNAPVSSCYQLIQTLQRRGYVYALPGKSYYPTKRMLKSAEVIAASDPVVAMLSPMLEELRDVTGESVLLGKHAEEHVLVLDLAESHHSIRYTTRPGELRHLHSSSIGKALLGSMTRDERDRWLPADPLPTFTPTTIATRAKLEADLQRSKARGWYASLGETVTELHSVAAPFTAAGAIFAVSVAGPVTRFAPSQKAHATALLAAVRKVDALLEKSA
jgi:IclR family transcriptional regulator, acetate operon repressor